MTSDTQIQLAKRLSEATAHVAECVELSGTPITGDEEDEAGFLKARGLAHEIERGGLDGMLERARAAEQTLSDELQAAGGPPPATDQAPAQPTSPDDDGDGDGDGGEAVPA